MIKVIRILSILVVGAALVGCSDNHLLHMKDGNTKVAQGKPQLDRATGLVIYTDESGKQQAVNQSEIRDMNTLDD